MASERQFIKCIKCEETMDVLMVAEVEIDRCPGCGGLWLDGGEIKLLAAKPAEALNEIRAIDNYTPSVNPTDRGLTAGVLDKPCPGCSGKLTHAIFGSTAVEHCNACDGIYVDSDELQKAMALVDTTAATTIVALAKSVETSGEI